MKLHSCQKQGSICNLVLASLIVAVCGLMGLAGCVSLTPTNKESLLKSAGFRERTPTTEAEGSISALPAYHLHKLTLKEPRYAPTG
jgi:hypothetical protein